MEVELPYHSYQQHHPYLSDRPNGQLAIAAHLDRQDRVNTTAHLDKTDRANTMAHLDRQDRADRVIVDRQDRTDKINRPVSPKVSKKLLNSSKLKRNTFFHNLL